MLKKHKKFSRLTPPPPTPRFSGSPTPGIIWLLYGAATTQAKIRWEVNGGAKGSACSLLFVFAGCGCYHACFYLRHSVMWNCIPTKFRLSTKRGVLKVGYHLSVIFFSWLKCSSEYNIQSSPYTTYLDKIATSNRQRWVSARTWLITWHTRRNWEHMMDDASYRWRLLVIMI